MHYTSSAVSAQLYRLTLPSHSTISIPALPSSLTGSDLFPHFPHFPHTYTQAQLVLRVSYTILNVEEVHGSHYYCLQWLAPACDLVAISYGLRCRHVVTLLIFLPRTHGMEKTKVPDTIV